MTFKIHELGVDTVYGNVGYSQNNTLFQKIQVGIVDNYLFLFIYLFLIFLLSRWLPELRELVADFGDKLANKQKPRKPKPATGNLDTALYSKCHICVHSTPSDICFWV